MKQHSVRRIVLPGVICALLLAAASGYSMAFNGGRLVEPMDFSTYVFRAGDLPMLLALALTVCYVGYLVVLLVGYTLSSRRRQASARTARAVNPRLGLLGLLGFLGFLGFWTYRTDGSIFPFGFFLFFGFFGFFFEGKLSGTLMDERYRENQLRAPHHRQPGGTDHHLPGGVAAGAGENHGQSGAHAGGLCDRGGAGPGAGAVPQLLPALPL